MHPNQNNPPFQMGINPMPFEDKLSSTTKKQNNSMVLEEVNKKNLYNKT